MKNGSFNSKLDEKHTKMYSMRFKYTDNHNLT